MRYLDVDLKPKPIENLDIYNFASVFLSTNIYISPSLEIDIQGGKDLLVEFNCVDGYFNYENFVPNKTVLEAYNEKLATFADAYPEWEDEINDRFSEYLWLNSRHDLEGNFKKEECSCFIEDFKDVIEANPQLHQKYLSENSSFIKDYRELVFEYDNDELAFDKARIHRNTTKDIEGALVDEYGTDWRNRQHLKTVKKGHELENYVEKRLMEEYGIDIGLIYDQKGQTKGETKVGIEFKNDLKSDETGNCYVEIAESRHGEGKVKNLGQNKNGMTYSGLMKNDKFLVFGPIDKLLIVRTDILKACYDQRVLMPDPNDPSKKIMRKNTAFRQRGVFYEHPNGKPNAIDPIFSATGKSEQIENGKKTIDVSVAFTITRNQLEEIAEDFGVDGIARVLIADGVSHTYDPPKKSATIERDKIAYAIDKLKGFENFDNFDGTSIPKINYDKIFDVSKNSDDYNNGIHVRYTDNKILNDFVMAQPNAAKYRSLCSEMAEAERKYNGCKFYDNLGGMKKNQGIYNELQTKRDALVGLDNHGLKLRLPENIKSSVSAYVEIEEIRRDYHMRFPYQSKEQGKGIRDSKADRYVHIITQAHNSQKDDMTYEFDRENLVKAIESYIEKNNININKEHKANGIQYIDIPVSAIEDLNKEFNFYLDKQHSTHVNATIDLTNSKLRHELAQEQPELEMDYNRYEWDEQSREELEEKGLYDQFEHNDKVNNRGFNR